MIRVKHRGDFKKMYKFLNALPHADIYRRIEEYARLGVDTLSSATPMRTGLTADSWSYEIEQTSGRTRIIWTNSNVNDGVNIAIILQYGHGTRNGGYVEGRDYINPAIQPIMDTIADNVWKEVAKL